MDCIYIDTLHSEPCFNVELFLHNSGDIFSNDNIQFQSRVEVAYFCHIFFIYLMFCEFVPNIENVGKYINNIPTMNRIQTYEK
jgi:hypothetical protein